MISQIDLTKMESPFVDEVPGVFHNHQVCVIYVDRRCFMGGAETFNDVDYTITTVQQIVNQQSHKLLQNPVELMRTVRTLQVIAYNSFLGNTLTDKNISEIVADNVFKGPENSGGGSYNIRASYLSGPTGEFIPKVQQYVETVRDENDGVKGWRLFYVANDKEFSFDRAFVNYCEIQRKLANKRQDKKSTTEDERRILPFTLENEWFDRAVQSYYDDVFTENELNRIQGGDPMSVEYPASIYKVFSLERAIKWEQIQQSSNSYDVEDYMVPVEANVHMEDDGFGNDIVATNTDTFKIVFPSQAYKVHSRLTQPSIFFSIPLENFHVQKDYTNETEEEKILRLKEERERLFRETPPQNSVDAFKKLVLEKRQQGILLIWKKTAEFERLFQSMMRSDTMCPASIAAYKWFQQLPTDQSFVIVPTELIDPHLTFTGNMLALDSFMLENVMNIMHLHHEMMLLLIAFLSAGDIEAKGEVRMNIMLNGPASSGKSHMMNETMELMIPGTYLEVASQTKNAMTTDENTNGMGQFFDEVPAHFLDLGDGNGNSVAKTSLSKGKVVNKMCFIGKEKAVRETIETVTYCKCLNIFGSNPGENAFAIPIISRFACLPVTLRDHPTRNEVTETFAEQDEDNTDDTPRVQYQRQWRIRFFIAYVLQLLIRVGFCPRPDVLLPAVLIQKIRKMMIRAGYRLDSRHYFRLMIMTQCVCFFTAIARVFNTEEFFKKDTPFRINHVLECIPFLECTREHIITALGLLFPSMVKPNTDYVLETIYSIIQDQPGDSRYLVRYKDGVKEIDYNYFVLDVSHSSTAFGKDMINNVCDKILQRMNHSSETLSRDNVHDVIKWIERYGSYKRRFRFISAGKWVKLDEPIMGVRMYMREVGTQCGLVICREYLELMLDKKGKLRPDCTVNGLLYDCVRNLLKGTPMKDKHRYITGSMRRFAGKAWAFDVYDEHEYQEMKKKSRIILAEKMAAYTIISKKTNEGDAPVYNRPDESDKIIDVDVGITTKEQLKLNEEWDEKEQEQMKLEAEWYAIGKGAWNENEEKRMYAYRKENLQYRYEYENEEEFRERLWEERKVVEEKQRVIFIDEKIAAMAKKREITTEDFLRKVGKKYVNKRGCELETEDDYIDVGRMHMESLNEQEWLDLKEKKLDDDICLFGQAIWRANRRRFQHEKIAKIDEDLEGFMTVKCYMKWSPHRKEMSLAQYIRNELRKIDPELKMTLDELAHARWLNKLDLEPEDVTEYEAPPDMEYLFENYPKSMEPVNFIQEYHVYDELRELVAPTGTTTTTTTKRLVVDTGSKAKKQRTVETIENEFTNTMI